MQDFPMSSYCVVNILASIFVTFRSLFLGHSNPKFAGFPDPGTAGSKRYSTKPAATPPRLACRCAMAAVNIDVCLSG